MVVDWIKILKKLKKKIFFLYILFVINATFIFQIPK